MADISNVRQLVSVARSRILLICPDCGQEYAEFADRLRGVRFYSCVGDGCDYRFDLFAGPRNSFLQRVMHAVRRLFAFFRPAT
jgi:hypothetical protein